MEPIYTYLYAMSFATTLFPMSGTAFPFSHLLLMMVQLTLLGGVLMFFRPLLVGVVRALALAVWPRAQRPSKAHS